MVNPKNSKQGIHRRDFIKGGAAASLGLASGSFGVLNSCVQASEKKNAIQLENAKPGTRDWLLTKTDVIMNEPVELWRSPRIEGYCSDTSVSAGETLKVMVSTNPVSQFSLDIYRTGYYGGTGGRFMKRFDSVQGKTQTDPEIGENRLRECKWEPSVEFEIPEDWLSGVYLGKLTASEGGVQSYVIFIVRDNRPCDLLFQCSDFTWQAYNSWPTNEWSLYHDDNYDYTGYKGRKKWAGTSLNPGWVSFDRPYGQFCQDHIINRPSSVGSGEFLLWEFPLSYWLEQQGYDVSYFSNLDTHRHGKRMLKTKGFISVGHDEYWSRQMYDNAIAARDAGVNLVFLSGNAVCWQVPLLPSADGQDNRIIRKEALFFGEEIIREMAKQRGFKGKLPIAPDAALLMGGRHAGLGGGDWICTNPGHWLYEGTDMKEKDTIKDLVGWEWHGHPASDLPGHEILATSNAVDVRKRANSSHAATIYNGPKDNIVFNAGCIWYAQGLSSPPGHVLPTRNGGKIQGPDPRVQRMTKNVFDRFLAKKG